MHVDIGDIDIDPCLAALNNAGIHGDDLHTGLAHALKVGLPNCYPAWRAHIATLTPAQIAAEYGYDTSRHVQVLAHTTY